MRIGTRVVLVLREVILQYGLMVRVDCMWEANIRKNSFKIKNFPPITTALSTVILIFKGEHELDNANARSLCLTHF